MFVRQEDGSINWNAVITSILTAAIVAMTGALINMSNTMARVVALQEVVHERVKELERGMHPSTANRFTRDDAVALELRLDRRIERLENPPAGGARR